MYNNSNNNHDDNNIEERNYTVILASHSGRSNSH